MDDICRRQAVAAGQPRLARRAAAERAALGQKLWTGGAVDRAIDPATAEQRGVGGVDDRIDGKPSDVGELDADPVMRCFHAGHLSRIRDSRRPKPGRLALTTDQTGRLGMGQESSSWLRSRPNSCSSRMMPSPLSSVTLLG
jgi:hypothetical protein